MRLVRLALLSTIALAGAAADNAAPARANAYEPIAKDSYAPIVRKVGPSVVTVFSSRAIHGGAGFGSPDDPGIPDELRQFFGGRLGQHGRSQQQRPEEPTLKEQGLGSGVVVSADGYILTNNHVVSEAEEVKVSLVEGGDEYPAKVVGADPRTDVAVLKIDPGGTRLSPIEFADSAKVEVGDVVLAVGNPMGIGQTVTLGIISATGRVAHILGAGGYEDFLQTDAAINPGNSGGALIDTQGRLIGINTAILSRSGGNIGIGFAVPSNLVRGAMDQIIKTGKVTRGYLGVMIQAVSPDYARLKKLPDRQGALVGGVEPDGPAKQAGIEPYDIIVGYANEPVADAEHLRLRVAQTAPGTKVPVKVRRGQEEKTFEVTVKDLAESGQEQAAAPQRPQRPAKMVGVSLQELTDPLRKELQIPREVRGAMVAEVEPGSRAERAGLKPGDVIEQVDQHEVTSVETAAKALREGAEGKEGFSMQVWSQGGSRIVAVLPGQ